jgi:hypothetical protein
MEPDHILNSVSVYDHYLRIKISASKSWTLKKNWRAKKLFWGSVYDPVPWSEADWPYNEVGKIPRAPFSLKALKINEGPEDKRGPLSMTFFFRQHYCLEPPITLFDLFLFGALLKKIIPKFEETICLCLWSLSAKKNFPFKNCTLQKKIVLWFSIWSGSMILIYDHYLRIKLYASKSSTTYTKKNRH